MYSYAVFLYNAHRVIGSVHGAECIGAWCGVRPYMV